MKQIKIILLLVIGIIVGCVIGIKAEELINSNQIIYKDKETVYGALDNLFDALYVGKEKIAKAITNKGVETTKEDSFDTIADNINVLASSSSKLELITYSSTSDDGNNCYTYYDVSSYSGYESFTVDNFLPVINAISYAGLDTTSHTFIPTKSYDATTGILTFKYRYVVRGSYSGAVSVNMYLLTY